MTPSGSHSDRPHQGLQGIRVLELGEMVSAPYATKLLADLGADVLKVETPEGDRARTRGPFAPGTASDQLHNASGLYLALNTNKRTIVIDPSAPDTYAQLNSLMAEADICITNFRADKLDQFGLDLLDLHRRYPALVLCSITPFGLTGPYANYAAEEITVANAGGWAYLSPGASSEEDQPPLKVFGHQTDFHSALAAAMACIATYDRSEQTGVGDLIDFSTMAHTAGMLEAGLIAASYMDVNPSRLGSRVLNPWRMFECTDGLIFIVTIEEDQWQRLVEVMGHPEWVEMGLFDTMDLRLENEDLLVMYIEEWTRQHAVNELWEKAQANRVCFAPVSTMAAMHSQPHLRERGFFVSVDHPEAGEIEHLGPPFLSTACSWGPLGPAPTLPPHAKGSSPNHSSLEPIQFNSSRRRHLSQQKPPVGDRPATHRPLEGLRVLDFSWVWAGPYCGLHLGFLGAEVIKVESANRPGLGRRLPLHAEDVEPSLNTNAYFNQWEQGKLSVAIDLSHPDAVDVVKKLVAQSDIVIENFATGVMDRMGLGYEELRSVKPDLIVASIAGYGSTGPLKDYMGYGPTTGPLSGLSELTGYAGGGPRELGVAVGDPASGITAAFAICAAVVERRVTGKGCSIDVSLWEATTSNAVEGWMQFVMAGDVPPRSGNRDPIMAPHNCYRAAEETDPTGGPGQSSVSRAGGEVNPGYWLSIACATDEQWQSLAGVINSKLRVDPRFATAVDRKLNEDALDAEVGAWVRSKNRWAATAELQAVGVPAFPSLSPHDLLTNEHLWDRQFFEKFDHAEVGKKVHTGMPWRSHSAPNGVTGPAPLLGEHTEEVLTRLLKLSPQQIALGIEDGLLR